MQKKCLIVSAGLHSLLVVILFIGPAFLAPKNKPDNLPLLEFIPLMTTDAMASGGGTQNAHSAPPAPPSPPPAPPETKHDAPTVREPNPPVVKETKPEADSLEPSNKKPKVEISTKVVTRSRDTAKADAKAKAEKEAREAAQDRAARQRIANEVERAAANIGNGIAGGTSIKLEGPGGGGVPYANFLQAVKSVYTRAWIVPDGIADDDVTVTASVTIARDGTVVTGHITRSSGNSAVDASVRATLDRVTFAAPLPPNAKEDQRTVTINFNVKAKRLLG
ncbi:MAG TPA: cell envelope integrity protein TolA [Candidatus Binatia bacterium]|nr:cell envelope integrity protein TolA [Candidatus Binatia bacterium]